MQGTQADTQQSPAICVYCGSSEHISSQCCNRPWDNREQPCSMPEPLRNQEFQHDNSEMSGNTGFQSANSQGQTSQPHLHRLYSEILGNDGSYEPNNNTSSQFSRGNQNHNSDQRRNTLAGSGRHSTREQLQNQYANNSSSNFRNYEYQQRGPAQSHARFDERYNQQYSPPIYPPTPSLNSSFPEALSKSLLQITENQSRTTGAMKASQEAQAEAHKEMSRTNKMRDDDALFNSIKVYDGSNPAKFKKWMDSIDQATHITGRDLKKELLKKLDGVIRNSLTMMDATWSDDDIISKLCQDFSSLSTMNRAREELKSLYQELGEPITVFIYKYGQMHFLSTGIRSERKTHPFAITGFISALEPQLNQIVAKRYTDAGTNLILWRKSSSWQNSAPGRCRRPVHWARVLH